MDLKNDNYIILKKDNKVWNYMESKMIDDDRE